MKGDVLAGPLLMPLNTSADIFPMSHVKLIERPASACICDPKCPRCQWILENVRKGLPFSIDDPGLSVPHKHDPKCPAPDGPGDGFNHG